MSLLKLPEIRADFGAFTQLEAPIEHLERWNPALTAKAGSSDNTISIYDSIGENWDGTGVRQSELMRRYVRLVLRMSL